MIGTKLAHYEITSHIGSGGMGDVYQANDTKLGRSVAVKLLPEAFAHDADRLARFQREARVLASLNHPNIAAIYGLERSTTQNFLVMELVRGETLAERIKRGPIPVDESLRIAQQIAEAMEAAHEKGVVHRDLKPANVKVTPEGKVKVLDFGLAKACEREQTVAALSNSPTISLAATNAGLILGTAAYMSPEQAKGKDVDKRTDIWALGCILYELLTAKPSFAGDSTAEILSNVLKTDPDWSALPNTTPVSLVTLLRRCLRKDPQQRLKDAGDIKIEIEDVRAASAPVAPLQDISPATTASRHWLVLAVLLCLGASTVTGFAVWKLRSAPPQPVERLAIALPPDQTLVRSPAELVALSPDGRRIAYVAARAGGSAQIYVRAMDALEANALQGTEGTYSFFFSPDSQWIGFFTGGALKKISINGGAAITLTPVALGLGGAWGPNDIIVFAPYLSGLMKISGSGGDPQPFTIRQPGENGHSFPQFLPDGKTVLFTVYKGGSADNSQAAVQRLDSGEHKILVQGATYARYTPTGHLIYYRAGTILAVPFDLGRLDLRGAPLPVVENVMSSGPATGAAAFSVSNAGLIAYVAGSGSFGGMNLVWVDRRGSSQILPAPPRPYRVPRLSPDGHQVAVVIGTDIWTYDLIRTTLTRFTSDGNVPPGAGAAVWTPDGKRIVFPHNTGPAANLFWKAADGSGQEERLTTSENSQQVGSVSPDNRSLICTSIEPKTGRDLWVMPLDGDRKPRPFLQTSFQESSGQISPDGHWVAYSSDESGRLEVYVRPFPNSGGKSQVSTEGGSEVAWSQKGHELFYRAGSQKEKMMVVDVQTQPTFSADKPRLLFEGAYLANGGGNTTAGAGAFYSVAPDGEHFLMLKAPEEPQGTLTKINVVLNWFRELQERVPVK
jgi:serine/threonine-protein kinase